MATPHYTVGGLNKPNRIRFCEIAMVPNRQNLC